MPPKKPPGPSAAKPVARAPAKAAAAKPGAPKPAAAKKPVAGAKPGIKPAAGAKKAVPAGKGKPADEKQAPPVKKWTKEDDAALKIQTSARMYLARKELARRKKEKQDYEDLIDRLEKEAYVAVVKMQQLEVERQRQKDEEERRLRREDMKRRKRMLESAFDGDLDDINAVLKEVEKCDDDMGLGQDMVGQVKRKRHLLDIVDCEDANGNTPLSEAAGGGASAAIQLLIELGANVNSQGHFKRTPLYRAAFAGQVEACQILLSNGADPRLYADDGTTPEQVASTPAVIELLETWDIEQTVMLLEKLDEVKQQRNEQERLRREAEVSEMEDNIKAAEKEYQVKQRQLTNAQEELEKRIHEYDEALAQGFANMPMLKEVIHDAETGLEMARIDAEKVQQKLQELRMEMRESAKEENELPGIKANIRELEEVLMRDIGNKIADSGKWPLLIDVTQKASTFLRYRDTNYLNALNPQSMEKDRVRMAIVGALRFGKPVVLDMMGVDIYDVCCMRFDEVQEGLMKSIMDKSIMEEENYLRLLRETDGDDYDKNKFNQQRVQNFRLFLITQVPFPPEDLLEKCYPITVISS